MFTFDGTCIQRGKPLKRLYGTEIKKYNIRPLWTAEFQGNTRGGLYELLKYCNRQKSRWGHLLWKFYKTNFRETHKRESMRLIWKILYFIKIPQQKSGYNISQFHHANLGSLWFQVTVTNKVYNLKLMKYIQNRKEISYYFLYIDE